MLIAIETVGSKYAMLVIYLRSNERLPNSRVLHFCKSVEFVKDFLEVFLILGSEKQKRNFVIFFSGLINTF